jgi:D-arabinono-1,4-lactone oxidase
VATPDGFHHPASEAELVELVKTANREGRHLRVRGAAHSVSHAIYSETAGENRVNQHTPPPGDGIDVMLDRYRGWQVRDEGRKLVEAQAGIHIGADPSEPGATLDQSLLKQLAEEKRWTIDLTGGITHQTISGFTGTGSSGGSSQFSANDNLFGFRLIDGRGDVHELTRDDPEFFSMAPNLGLLGVVSAITFECSDLFAIEGSEVVTPIGRCPADLFGDGAGGRPSLEGLLRDTEFVRLEWWPQRGSERIVTWRASRIPADPGFRPRPYKRFGTSPEAAQQVIAIVFTILGNLDDLSKAERSSRTTSTSSSGCSRRSRWRSSWASPARSSPSSCGARSSPASATRSARSSRSRRSCATPRPTSSPRSSTRSSRPASRRRSAISAGRACRWTTASTTRCCRPRSPSRGCRSRARAR